MICSFEITCAFDCHFSNEWVPGHNSVIPLTPALWTLNCIVSSETSVLGQVLLLLLQSSLPSGEQAERGKSWRRTVVELSRQLCLFGVLAAPSQEGTNCAAEEPQSPPSADEWGTASHAQPPTCSAISIPGL